MQALRKFGKKKQALVLPNDGYTINILRSRAQVAVQKQLATLERLPWNTSQYAGASSPQNHQMIVAGYATKKAYSCFSYAVTW